MAVEGTGLGEIGGGHRVPRRRAVGKEVLFQGGCRCIAPSAGGHGAAQRGLSGVGQSVEVQAFLGDTVVAAELTVQKPCGLVPPSALATASTLACSLNYVHHSISISLTVVCESMKLQPALVEEVFTTDGAGERTLPCVRVSVNRHLRGHSEAAWTIGAFVSKKRWVL